MIKINRIISVNDTRRYELKAGRYRPIAGTGEASRCDRCGRKHEVWVTVALSDGSTAVVGTGCAQAYVFKDGAPSVESIAAAQVEVNAARAMLEICRRHNKKNDEALDRWSKVPGPPVTFEEVDNIYSYGGKIRFAVMGDVKLEITRRDKLEPLLQRLRNRWTAKRATAELGGTLIWADETGAEYRLRYATSKLDDLMARFNG